MANKKPKSTKGTRLVSAWFWLPFYHDVRVGEGVGEVRAVLPQIPIKLMYKDTLIRPIFLT